MNHNPFLEPGDDLVLEPGDEPELWRFCPFERLTETADAIACAMASQHGWERSFQVASVLNGLRLEIAARSGSDEDIQEAVEEVRCQLACRHMPVYVEAQREVAAAMAHPPEITT